LPGRSVRSTLGGNAEPGSGVQGDLVLATGARPETVDHQQRVVVPGHLEGPRPPAEDFDLAGPVGLHPYRGGGLAYVTQHGAEHKHRRFAIRLDHDHPSTQNRVA